MWRELQLETWCSIRFLVSMSVLLGLVYPLGVTAIATWVFPHQATGSIVRRDGAVVASTLVGQPFTRPKYFWPRPSATGGVPYNAAASGGSNLGPLNPDLKSLVAARAAAFRAANPGYPGPVPLDLLTASGSGLDPHISPAAARFQLERVANARKLDLEQVHALVKVHVEQPTFGLLGEPRVNVVELNLALDSLDSKTARASATPSPARE